MSMTIAIPIGTMYNWPYPTSGVIVVTNNIGQTFQKAHHALLKKRGRPPTGKHMSVMKQWWWEEYAITIIDDWFALEFASDQALTMFLLRWS